MKFEATFCTEKGLHDGVGKNEFRFVGRDGEKAYNLLRSTGSVTVELDTERGCASVPSVSDDNKNY